MIRLADHLAARDVKATNLAMLEAGNYEGRSTSPTSLAPEQVRQAVSAVKTSDLDQVIRAVPPFSDGDPDVRQAWAHWMSLLAGRHFFPDANHRTAALAFSLAMSRSLGTACFLPPELVAAMVAESKAWRRKSSRPTVAELANDGHPYRKIFLRHAQGLRFMPL